MPTYPFNIWEFLAGLGFDTEGLIYPDQWESAETAPREGLPASAN